MFSKLCFIEFVVSRIGTSAQMNGNIDKKLLSIIVNYVCEKYINKTYVR